MVILMFAMSSQNPIEALPDDLVDRASTLFMSTMQYAVELLTWEQHDSLPVGLQPEGELPNTYVTMLFNDEVHTYEQVGCSGTGFPVMEAFPAVNMSACFPENLSIFVMLLLGFFF